MNASEKQPEANRRKVELLAPAGTREALVAAVENGANAVYLSGARFGARAFAANFDREGLREAIRFAHLRNVAIHVTVNTIVADEETETLAGYLRFLYEAGADAILVQDLGVARLARRVVPDLPLHASTQMTVHNLAGALELERLGFSRIVLARELSLAEIREICAACRAEIEVFIHGALCVCYSGQCLMSSLIGGRSGNRGRCAQPCRLPYALVDETGQNLLEGVAGQFLLSPRDLNTSALLPELIDAGVASLKIEGRMKRPEYVAVVTGVYRRAIDAGGFRRKTREDSDQKRLAQIFNRDFTTAYLEKNPGQTMMSDRRPNNRGLLVGRVLQYDAAQRLAEVRLTEDIHPGDQIDFWVKSGGRVTVTVNELTDENGRPVEYGPAGGVVRFPVTKAVHPHDRLFRVYDAVLMATAQATFKSGAPLRRIPVDARFTASIGQPPSLRLTAEGQSVEAVSDVLGQAAQKHPLTEESVLKQLERLGTTVYRLQDFQAILDGDVMVPVSVLNDLRRQAVTALDEARLRTHERPPLPPLCHREPEPSRSPAGAARLMVAVDSLEKAAAALQAGADGLLFGGDTYDHRTLSADDYRAACRMAREKGCLIHFNTPRIVREARWEALRRLFDEWAAMAPDGINVHNIATLALAREAAVAPVQSDWSLIAYNALAAAELKELGASRVTASPELSLRQLEELAKACPLPLEAIVHGRLELMVSAYCVMGSFLGGAGEHACSGPCRTGRYFLKDRKDALFPIVTDAACQMHILNSKTLSLLPHVGRLPRMGVDRLRLEARYLSAGEIRQVVEAYRTVLAWGPELTEEQEHRCWELEGKDITRGHYFRGVL